MANLADGPKPRLYRTEHQLSRRLLVSYPAHQGRIVIRTEYDWDLNIEPIAVSPDGNTSTFEVTADQPFLYFKPCLIQADSVRWAAGPNCLLLLAESAEAHYFPYFFAEDEGKFSELITFPSKTLDRDHRLRVYLPPGYYENTLARYPIIYMQDGQNLFFPEEAFQGHDWKVSETSQILRAMRSVADVVIIGIYSGDRMKEYTRPGYEAYARSLVDEVIPVERERLRAITTRRCRAVWGSSLGGVVSFYSAWQYPEVFTMAACMSSTFSHKDDLIDRVLTEPKRDVGFYLDSGWPGDNYEVTMAMATALVSRGWRYGHDMLHLSFPKAAHNEEAWGIRLHIPMQFFVGAVARASRFHHPVLSH